MTGHGLPGPAELARGELEIVGRLVDASNATFLATLPDGRRAVYKPVRGERPLDDFAHGTLASRERAAFLLSEATGWAIVPPTVLRDGPFGRGMVQAWVEVDESVEVMDLLLAPDPRLRRIAVFDVLANNADRKGGHLLPLAGGHIHAVDHGVTFAVEPKLRTVLWAWRGEPLADDELAVAEAVCSALEADLGTALGELLSPAEVAAARRRARALLRARRFPQPDPLRPALPWPPF
ncbi:MAG TPA: SCO1664 family protein [Candidatus Limnocylindrales bacterium]